VIHGVGTDVVQISRMQAVWQRHGEKFARRTLMPEEMAWFTRSKNPVRFLAIHFAAKEAIVKALGTGFRHGMWVRDAGFVPDRRGKPCVIFSERGMHVCKQFGVGAAHVSLTDEAGLVVAMAVAEKIGEV
jgi:holo-[acyl-carrier protein] synthase